MNCGDYAWRKSNYVIWNNNEALAFASGTNRELARIRCLNSSSNARKGKARSQPVSNPKLEPAISNQIKDRDEWVSGSEPDDRRAGFLSQDPSEEAHQPDLYDPNLDKAEASKRIDQLRGKTGRD